VQPRCLTVRNDYSYNVRSLLCSIYRNTQYRTTQYRTTYRLQAGSVLIQAGSVLIQAGSVLIQAGSVLIQAGFAHFAIAKDPLRRGRDDSLGQGWPVFIRSMRHGGGRHQLVLGEDC